MYSLVAGTLGMRKMQWRYLLKLIWTKNAMFSQSHLSKDHSLLHIICKFRAHQNCKNQAQDVSPRSHKMVISRMSCAHIKCILRIFRIDWKCYSVSSGKYSSYSICNNISCQIHRSFKLANTPLCLIEPSSFYIWLIIL